MADRSARAVALAALTTWRRGKRFADAIVQQLLVGGTLSAADRGFVTELFYGVLRNLTLLDFWIAQLRSGSLDHISRDLLRLGLYQLFCLRTPAHAAVNETVELATVKNRSLINAILRTALRQFADLESAAETQPVATRYSHPQFLIDRWTDNYGAEAANFLCSWNNQSAPVYARINQLKISPAQFLKKYPTAAPLPDSPNFVHLDRIPAEALACGECYIQDPSTAVACELLDARPNETILDACAAPGGKSSYLAELMRDRGRLVACDRDPDRLAVLRTNLQILGISCAETLRHDWKELPANIPTGSFDRILLDAPCSNTGVMRRRVDVRWRLTPRDFARMQGQQLTILRAALPLLKPGGALVYSTCSIEPEENEQVVSRTLHEFPFLKPGPQKSILPFRDRLDGAFAARLDYLT